MNLKQTLCCLLVAAAATSVVSGAVLTDTIEQLRINNSASIKQVGNVDVIQVENTDTGTIDEIGICHIPTIL
jgi:hypothetical protein